MLSSRSSWWGCGCGDGGAAGVHSRVGPAVVISLVVREEDPGYCLACVREAPLSKMLESAVVSDSRVVIEAVCERHQDCGRLVIRRRVTGSCWTRALTTQQSRGVIFRRIPPPTGVGPPHDHRPLDIYLGGPASGIHDVTLGLLSRGQRGDCCAHAPGEIDNE